MWPNAISISWLTYDMTEIAGMAATHGDGAFRSDQLKFQTGGGLWTG